MRVWDPEDEELIEASYHGKAFSFARRDGRRAGALYVPVSHELLGDARFDVMAQYRDQFMKGISKSFMIPPRLVMPSLPSRRYPKTVRLKDPVLTGGKDDAIMEADQSVITNIQTTKVNLDRERGVLDIDFEVDFASTLRKIEQKMVIGDPGPEPVGFLKDMYIGFGNCREPRKLRGQGISGITFGETANLDWEKLKNVLDRVPDTVLQSTIQPEQLTRKYPMKTTTVTIPFDRDNPSLPILVDVPNFGKVVHIDTGGEDDEDVDLFVSHEDNPTRSYTATAFFVVPLGTDMPGFIVDSDNMSGRGRGASTEEGFDPVHVRRIGKFERGNGQVLFVFERLDRSNE